MDKNNKLYKILSNNHKGANPSLYLSTVSGVASTNSKMISYFDKRIDAIDIITTKSFQVTPNPGNREPIICETETGNFGNSVGLRNPGMDVVYPQLVKLREKGLNKFLNISVSANSIEDFITLVKKFDDVADAIELNFSCPHASAGFGASIGCDMNIASQYVKEIKEACNNMKALLFIKLTPNVSDIGAIAKACVEQGADGIVAINTVGPIVHYEKNSGLPILQNSIGGAGGMSGEWVYKRALQAIREIREAIPSYVPLLAMGGVSCFNQVKAMVESGADAVGIGSALSLVNQSKWSEYLNTIKDEYYNRVVAIPSSSYLSDKNQMEYTEMYIDKIEYHGNDTITLTLDKDMRCEAGEFAFLWLPGIGEKPFTLSCDKPVTFIIKRRGIFTKALWNLNLGDKLYVRGMYGAKITNRISKKAICIAGGTGIAVLPALARKLKEEATLMSFYVGTSEINTKEELLSYELSIYGKYQVVADDGVVGRVLQEIDTADLSGDINAYLIGPEIFMAIAAKKLIDKGFDKNNIYLSMEKITRCGVGLCGECVCGETLTCQSGSFVSYNYIEENENEILKR
ncbi:MAG: nitronate monooxygenase [Spirochaetaceae bacterium]|nr:nitronate monooxygenase [Spirochaetaceae bacterium]